MVNWLLPFMHVMPFAFSLARARAGRSRAAKIAIIAMTTNSSMSVNACLESFFKVFDLDYCPSSCHRTGG